jgi:hypothetical protein
MMLRPRLLASEAVSPGADLFQSAGPCQPRECASMDPLIGDIASPQDGLRPCETQDTIPGLSLMRSFAYTH